MSVTRLADGISEEQDQDPAFTFEFEILTNLIYHYYRPSLLLMIRGADVHAPTNCH